MGRILDLIGQKGVVRELLGIWPEGMRFFLDGEGGDAGMLDGGDIHHCLLMILLYHDPDHSHETQRPILDRAREATSRPAGVNRKEPIFEQVWVKTPLAVRAFGARSMNRMPRYFPVGDRYKAFQEPVPGVPNRY